MENIIRDIEDNCNDKSIKGIIKFMHASGDIPVTSEYYREVWHFYIEACDMLKSKMQARRLTKEFMKINESKFKRIKTRYESRSIN